MKTQNALRLVILSALIIGHSSTEASAEPRTVTVNGQAEVRVAPDEVTLSLGIETFDPDLVTAKAENDAHVNAVVAAAEKAEIPREHIKLDHLEIHPVYKDNDELAQFRHYRVRRTVVMTLRDLERFEVLLSSVLEAGANYVHGVEFRTTELRKHRDQARSLAIRAAKEKAEALAAELDTSIGRVHKISEGYARWRSGYGSWWGRRSGRGMSQNVVQSAGGPGVGGDGPMLPGQISVDASVTVSFVLAP